MMRLCCSLNSLQMKKKSDELLPSLQLLEPISLGLERLHVEEEVTARTIRRWVVSKEPCSL